MPSDAGFGLLEALTDRVLVADGAMGTMQAADLTLDDFAGLEDPEPIGVKLSEEFQLHPEQSTDAIVLHHPEAKYFNT